MKCKIYRKSCQLFRQKEIRLNLKLKILNPEASIMMLICNIVFIAGRNFMRRITFCGVAGFIEASIVINSRCGGAVGNGIRKQKGARLKNIQQTKIKKKS